MISVKGEIPSEQVDEEANNLWEREWGFAVRVRKNACNAMTTMPLPVLRLPLRAGMCHIREPVLLGPADSNLEIVGVGTKTTPSPGISGGVAITGWTVSAKAACKGCGNIYVATLPADARECPSIANHRPLITFQPCIALRYCFES